MKEQNLNNLVEAFLIETLSSSLSTADLLKKHGLNSFYSSVPTKTLIKVHNLEAPKLKNTPDRMMSNLARSIGAAPATAATKFAGASLGPGFDELEK